MRNITKNHSQIRLTWCRWTLSVLSQNSICGCLAALNLRPWSFWNMGWWLRINNWLLALLFVKPSIVAILIRHDDDGLVMMSDDVKWYGRWWWWWNNDERKWFWKIAQVRVLNDQKKKMMKWSLRKWKSEKQLSSLWPFRFWFGSSLKFDSNKIGQIRNPQKWFESRA